MRRAGSVTVGDARERLDGAGWLFPLAGVPTAARHWPPLCRTSQRLAAHAARAPATWLTP
jgi:hypothetical protein